MNRALSVGDLNPIPAICRPSELDVARRNITTLEVGAVERPVSFGAFRWRVV